jgi:hypothetical protein
MADIWVRVFDNLMNDVVEQLDKDMEATKNHPKGLGSDYPEKLKRMMENAAVRASESILPCKGE